MKTWFLLAALAGAAPGETLPGPAPVAFAFRVEGKVRIGGTPPADVEPWRRLFPGEVLETSPGSTVRVVYFGSGRIYLLEPGGRGRVEARELVPQRGKVRLVKDLPAKVKLAVLLGPKANRRPAAGIVRGEEEEGFPRVPVAGAALCLPRKARVEVLDEEGKVVFQAEGTPPRIEVPTRSLRPGRAYAFRVAGKEGYFTTLESTEERARVALAKEAARDPELEELRARVDEELGVRGCVEVGFNAGEMAPPTGATLSGQGT